MRVTIVTHTDVGASALAQRGFAPSHSAGRDRRRRLRRGRRGRCSPGSRSAPARWSRPGALVRAERAGR
jgi:hypothetical protein